MSDHIGGMLVTGVTRTVGAPLLRTLHAAGQPATAAVRDPAHFDFDVPFRLLDFIRPETFPH